jgi:hypothetical protein
LRETLLSVIGGLRMFKLLDRVYVFYSEDVFPKLYSGIVLKLPHESFFDDGVDEARYEIGCAPTHAHNNGAELVNRMAESFEMYTEDDLDGVLKRIEREMEALKNQAKVLGEK